MYFYHEGYHDAYYTAAALEDLRSADRRVDDLTYEPLAIPVIVTWPVFVAITLSVIVTAIQVLS